MFSFFQVWTFTKVSSQVNSWLPSDDAFMTAHMTSCDYLKSEAIKYHSTEVWDTKDMKRIPRHLADFRRENTSM